MSFISPVWFSIKMSALSNAARLNPEALVHVPPAAQSGDRPLAFLRQVYSLMIVESGFKTR